MSNNQIERIAIPNGRGGIPAFMVGPERPIASCALFHAIGSCKEEYVGLACRIAEGGFEVCVPDLRGQGENGDGFGPGIADDAEAVIRLCRESNASRGLPSTIAIGHSLGGRLALASSADKAIGISPAIYAELSPQAADGIRDAKANRMRLDRGVAETFAALPRWEPREGGSELILFGQRDSPQIIEACLSLPPGARVLQIPGAMHGDIHVLEPSIRAILEALLAWARA